MIKRQAERALRQLAGEFKVVAVVGPRQAGKTTLTRSVFSAKPYVNFEELDRREFAQRDPRRFLEQFPQGAVLDEAQHVPDLLSYLQVRVDDRKQAGQFILTGSQNFGLVERITQSLAGRVGTLHLLPFSLEELHTGKWGPASTEELLFQGLYPPIYDQHIAPERWYNAYATTYMERDVRQMTNIRDLSTFQRLLKLCAGNVGQLLNTSRIGADCGVSHNTVKAWLSTLEAGYIVYLLRPHHQNFRKRLVKTPKLYFLDPGLAANLLEIHDARQLLGHPMRGPLFENWVLSELLKSRFNRAKRPNLFFWRSQAGMEVDILVDRGEHLLPIEVKSGQTVAEDWVKGLLTWRDLAGESAEEGWIVYGGDQRQQREGVTILPWSKINSLIKKI